MDKLCEHCGKNFANVTVTHVINNKKTQMHLCSDCAKQFGQISFFDLIGGMFNFENTAAPDFASSVPKCAKCGLTLNEFRSSTFLGCDECYNTFREQLKDILKQMNGNITHRGKVPSKLDSGVKQRFESIKLKNELEQAIKDEDYEKCIDLRDRIKKINTNPN